MWPLVVRQIYEKPWLGYGYETFWFGGWEGNPANIWIYLSPGFEPPHAHNGFLEMILSVGYIGLFVFIVGFLDVLLRSISWLRIHKTVLGLAPIVILVFLLIVNMTESMLMNDDLFWILYVSIIFSTRIPLAAEPTYTYLAYSLEDIDDTAEGSV
jgi:O-antigen ligase